MAQTPPALDGVDDRLARLLEVERDLEARVREAESAARARVEAVRQAATLGSARRLAEIHEAAQEEERADGERHAAELANIEAEAAAELRRLSSLTDEIIERLALRVYAHVVKGEGPP